MLRSLKKAFRFSTRTGSSFPRWRKQYLLGLFVGYLDASMNSLETHTHVTEASYIEKGVESSKGAKDNQNIIAWAINSSQVVGAKKLKCSGDSYS